MAKEKEQFVKEITDMSVNFPQWYTDVVLKTELVDYGPVKGTMVIRPYGYEVKEYVAVIDRIPTYFKRSMDLLKPEVREELFYKHSTILTKVKDSVPARYKEGANVKNSIIADGCVIDGTVENSILFRSVKVGKGAVIRNSIVMEDTIVMENASLDYTITDKDVIIQPGRVLSGYETYPMVVVKGKVI